MNYYNMFGGTDSLFELLPSPFQLFLQPPRGAHNPIRAHYYHQAKEHTQTVNGD